MNSIDFEMPLDPRMIDQVYTAAYHKYENGKYSEAINLFRFLVVSDTHSRKNWIGLGAAQQMLKEYDEAIQSYTFAALMDSNDPYVFLYTAHCLLGKGEVSLALQTLDSAEKTAAGQMQYTGLLAEVELLRQAWSQTLSNTQLKE